jgi:beta-glucanase (GH16 family)
MKKYFFSIGLILLAATAIAQRPPQGPTSTKQFNPKKQGYHLIWQDQFKGNKLDTSKWKVRGVGPRAIAHVSEEAVSVKNGYVTLSALKRGDSLLGSAIGTQGKFMAKYGYFECRAQLQQSPGVWAAFWIQSEQIRAGEDPSVYGAEIDIMEFFKKLGTDIVSHNVHWAYGPRQQTTRGMQSYVKNVSKGFHTFGLEWFPDRYIFYVDRLPFYEVRKGVSNIEEYLILSMEYPNKIEEIAKTIFPDTFVVDYVKVYQKKQPVFD